MEQTKRIEYIDALRGFTMILVVYHHIEAFSYHINPSFICQILMTFRMPLFFFISGYIAYKANQNWDISSLLSNISKKVKVQLIPTLFFGLIYTYLVSETTWVEFLKAPMKLGYWFTIVLLYFFIIYYTTSFLFQKFSHKVNKNSGGGNFAITLCVLSIILFYTKLIFRYNPYLHGAYDILSLYYVFTYFPFFVFGVIAKIYQEQFNKLFEHKLYSTLIIILFAGIFLFRFYFTKTNILPYSIISIIDPPLMILNGFLGITIVYNFFRKYQDSFSKETKLGRMLQYIGKRTLDIYLLHYFLLPDLSNIGEYFGSSSTVVGLFFGIIIALMVIAVCLVISSTIRLSPILGHYLFGAKKQ